MNIEYLTNNKIIFNNQEGDLMNDNKDFIEFVNEICQINTANYENIYLLKDNFAGQILLTKGNRYRWIVCGSGRPIISDNTGILQ